jgi:hypothetical protein
MKPKKKDKFWNKEFKNNFKKINKKRKNCFRKKINLVFKVIRESEYIHPKCREQVIKDLKEKIK